MNLKRTYLPYEAKHLISLNTGTNCKPCTKMHLPRPQRSYDIPVRLDDHKKADQMLEGEELTEPDTSRKESGG